MNHEATEVIDERDLPIFIHSELDELDLSLEAFRVYAHLARRTNKQSKDAWPSYNSIGEVCFRGSYPNSPKSTLRRMAIAAVKELAHRGLVRVEHRQGSDGSNITNTYYLTPRADWQSNPYASETLPGDKRTPGDGDDGTPPSAEGTPPGAGGTPKGTPTEGTPIEGIPTTPTHRPVVVEKSLLEKAEQREKVIHSLGESCPLKTSMEEPRVTGEDDSSAQAVSWKTLSQLESLGIRQNPKLLTAIANAPEATLSNAIACLHEAKRLGTIKSSTGFLIKAIEEQWTPNEAAPQAVPLGFREWFNLARELGLVIASQMVDGVLQVYTSSGKPEVWEEFATAFPLAELQTMVQRQRRHQLGRTALDNVGEVV